LLRCQEVEADATGALLEIPLAEQEVNSQQLYQSLPFCNLPLDNISFGRGTYFNQMWDHAIVAFT